jgi:hypothetical protein
MATEETVKAQLSNGTIEVLRIEVLTSGRDYVLTSHRPDGRTAEYQASDMYLALQKLRMELEAEGIRLLCAGARPDVAPSGMSRDMGGGRKAYVHPVGGPPALPDLLDIFDYAASELVGTVQEQRDYMGKWNQVARERWAQVTALRAGKSEGS